MPFAPERRPIGGIARGLARGGRWWGRVRDCRLWKARDRRAVIGLRAPGLWSTVCWCAFRFPCLPPHAHHCDGTAAAHLTSCLALRARRPASAGAWRP